MKCRDSFFIPEARSALKSVTFANVRNSFWDRIKIWGEINQNGQEVNNKIFPRNVRHDFK